MDIIARLSSQLGSRGQEANIDVAARCLKKPDLLRDIAARLADENARLAGDCAEVMTKVAEQRPELVAPHAKVLLERLAHDHGRVRWEAAHALALVAGHAPRVIAADLERLGRIARRDESAIVRDYVLDAIAGYAATGRKAAVASFPLLVEGVSSWNAKHAARVLRGLEGVSRAAPKLAHEIRTVAAKFADHARPGVRKAASALLRSIGAEKQQQAAAKRKVRAPK